MNSKILIGWDYNKEREVEVEVQSSTLEANGAVVLDEVLDKPPLEQQRFVCDILRIQYHDLDRKEKALQWIEQIFSGI